MTFENLEQRMARSYTDLFPKFIPDENAPVSKQDQKEFYTMMKNLYKLAFDEPLMFVSALHEDDAFPRRYNKKSYGKPDLEKNMKKFMKAVDDLLLNMYQAGKDSNVKFNKKQQEILAKSGITDTAKLPAAWKWMSERTGSNIVAFSHCFFRNDYCYTSDIFAPLIGEAAFRKLEKWMVKKGYTRFDAFDVTASSSKFTLNYINPKWSDEEPKGGHLFKIKHTGISVCYEPYAANPPLLGLRIPDGLKPYLEKFDSMDEKLKAFAVERTKKCDGCRYCVQTDKTGKRPLALVKVTYGKKDYSLCPYFPGFSYGWSVIDDELVEKLIAFLSFMDGLLRK